jgi:hypothetical protein
MLTTTFFRELLFTLSPPAREHTRNVLIRDQADRDAISSRLMRYRNQKRAVMGGHQAAGQAGLTCRMLPCNRSSGRGREQP